MLPKAKCYFNNNVLFYNLHFFHIAVLTIILIGCNKPDTIERQNPPEYGSIAEEMEYYLTDKLLKAYFPKVLDWENGGFLTNFSGTWQPLPPHNKVIVSQTRYVWAASEAAMRYPEDSAYHTIAEHGARFLLDSMWDAVHGGFFFTLPKPSTPDSAMVKRAYGQAFGIYALATYHRLTGDSAALKGAQDTFYWLEAHLHDPEYGGYFDFATREGISKTHPAFRAAYFRDFAEQAPLKDYNSSIHLLEAFTELYRVWPDSLLQIRLQEMLETVRDRFVRPEGYLQLFFERDWEPVLLQGQSPDYIRKHFHRDHVSFGHDIETGFLLLEAAEVLGISEDKKTRSIAKKLVDHTIEHGFDADFAGIWYAGYYFSKASPDTLSPNKDWWAQAEGLNALLLFHSLYPEETKYWEGFVKLWTYTKQHIIDQEQGGWYPLGTDTRPDARQLRKAQGWKACYHDGRALMRCTDLLRQLGGS